MMFAPSNTDHQHREYRPQLLSTRSWPHRLWGGRCALLPCQPYRLTVLTQGTLISAARKNQELNGYCDFVCANHA
jgi:hypothetical protein